MACVRDARLPDGGNVFTGQHFAYVGCRTTERRHAQGDGLRVYRIDRITGSWVLVQTIGGLINPSFQSFDRSKRFLYTVHGDGTEISSFRVDERNGELTALNCQSTGGLNPVHLVTDPGNRVVIVANYASGTVSVMPRSENGSLGPVQQLVELAGEPGPHRKEQASSHPHQAVWDNSGRHLFIPDKGTDRIFGFRFDFDAGTLTALDPWATAIRAGAGPRHMTFHPARPFAYIVGELDSSVIACHCDGERGTLRPFQVLPSTPDDFVGNNTAAAIGIASSGRLLFVSNRGHDSIGIFRVDAISGRLTACGWTSSGGAGPRFATLDPSDRFLYAANELSHSVIVFELDHETGVLAHTGTAIKVGSPTCVLLSAGWVHCSR